MHRKILRRIAADERKAPVDYRKIRKELARAADRRKIDSIIRDERRHFRVVKQLRRSPNAFKKE